MSVQPLAKLLLLVVCLGSLVSHGLSEILDIPFAMTEYNLTADGVKLCTARKLDFDTNSSYFVVGLEPHISPLVDHHVLFWSCEEQTNTHTDVWDCGAESSRQTQFPLMSPCLGGRGRQWFIFNNRNQSAFHFPAGVGLQFGPGTDIQSLVFAAHFVRVMSLTGGRTPVTGVTLKVAKVPKDQGLRKTGILTTYLRGNIAPHSLDSLSGTLVIEEDVVLHPFAIVFHTHHRSRKAVVAKISPSGESVEILDVDPRIGTYVDVSQKNITLRSGDGIRVSCLEDNTNNNQTLVVEFAEQCIMVMMYSVEGDELLSVDKVFFSPREFEEKRGFLAATDGPGTRFLLTDRQSV